MSKTVNWGSNVYAEIPERPMTIQEMVLEITEYEVNNMAWSEIRSILDQYYAHTLASMPPEALQERYDCIFNR